jgi:hypothetical protein
MAYVVEKRCDDGTLVLAPEAREPVQKGTPLHVGAERAGAVLETIGRVDAPLVVARVSKKFADEKEFV